MNWHFVPQSIVLFISAAISIFITVATWGRRRKQGGREFILMMALISLWCLATAFEAAAVDQSLKIFWSQVEYFGSATCGAFFFLFALHYTQQEGWFSLRWQTLLWIVPVITILLVWTNQYHNLVWAGFSPGSRQANVLIYHRGPWFWVQIMYTYFTVALGLSCIMISYTRADPVFKRQLLSLIIGAAFPLITGGMYITGLTPFKGMGVSPLGFFATGLIISWSMFRYRFMDLVPVGRAALMEKLPDGVLVLDGEKRIVEVNSAASELFGKKFSVGENALALFEDHPELNSYLDTVEEIYTQLHIEKDGEGGTYLEIRILPLNETKTKQGGLLVLFHNITGLKLAEQARDSTIGDLQQALAQIKTLRGLIPICCVCKNIRDDRGYWEKLESFIEEHSEASFTHGICPDCAQREYSNFYSDDSPETDSGTDSLP